ncbi:MAG: hypothetical protein Kow00106_14670 [Anaerolineae bacterium]
MSKTAMMTKQLSQEELERLSREISRADLQKLAERGLLGTAAPTSTPAERSRPASPSAGDNGALQQDRPIEVVRTAFGEVQQLRLELDLDEEKEEEQAPRRRFRLRDIPTYLTIGGLSLALIAERTYLYLRRAKRDFDRLPVFVRVVYYLAATAVVLLLVGFILGTQVTHLLGGGYNPPTLQESAAAPYGVGARLLPPSNAQPAQLLPETLGDFPRSTETISVNNTSSPTNHCLLGLGYARDVVNPPTCARSYGMLGTASARYYDGRMKVDVAIARFSNEQQAHGTMVELLIHARRYGRVGDFAVSGLTPNDYFYSNVRGWLSFTWSHGPWIFSISTVKLETLEEAIKAFPY